MSEDEKDFGDKAEDAFDNAKEKASEFAEDAKEKASEFAEDAKEAAGDFAEEAKKTANEFSEGLKSAGGDNKKILAGVLAIIFGSLGVHKFILGYNKEGFILLGASIISYVLVCFIIGAFLIYIPMLIGLIEGIIYLTKSDEEFYNTYQAGKKPWF
ncbi:MAG: NINE protein [Flavobacteriaceae bacterium]